MNILKILAVFAIFASSATFAQAAAQTTASSNVSAASSVSVSVKTTDAKNIDSETENSDEGQVDNEDSNKNTEVDSEIGSETQDNNSVFCTADAKICNDGTTVARVAPDCEFAECSTENENIDNTDNESEKKLNNDNEGDGVDESGTAASKDRISEDSFLNIFVDPNDEETKAAIDAFLKIDDTEGGDINLETNTDTNNDNVDKSSSDIKETSNKSSDESKKTIKIKEIVIVGSKVRSEVQKNNVEVHGWDSKKKEVTINPTNIKKKEDFLDFVGATVLNDKNIESVSLDSEKITMKYDQPAKLFGIIPMNLTAQVEFKGKNQLKIKFPWYTFLTKNDSQKIRDEIDVLSFSWGVAKNNGNTDLQERARKFQTISNALKTNYNTATSSTPSIK